MSAKIIRRNKIIKGNCFDLADDLPDESISCIITSPPYFNARDYETDPVIIGGSIHCNHIWDLINKESSKCNICGAYKCEVGRECLSEDYVNHLCELCNKLKRSLRNDGALWVNISDKYAKDDSEFPTKSLMLIPTRFAEKMIRSGWILRNAIIWKKKNPVPESVDDRSTPDYEYFFFFVKSNIPIYYINTKDKRIAKNSPVDEGIEGVDWDWFICVNCGGKGKFEGKICGSCNGKGKKKFSHWVARDYYYEKFYLPNTFTKICKNYGGKKYQDEKVRKQNSTFSRNSWVPWLHEGKNSRTTWEIAYDNNTHNHFAPFPQELVRRPLLMTCPEDICKNCGIPRFKVNQREIIKIDDEYYTNFKYIGLSECGCNAGYERGLVLDPFMGSGTTGIVAYLNGRDFIGYELSDKAIKIAEEQLKPYRNKRLTDFA